MKVITTELARGGMAEYLDTLDGIPRVEMVRSLWTFSRIQIHQLNSEDRK